MRDQPAKGTSFLANVEMGLGAWSWGDRFFRHNGHGYTDDDIAKAFHIYLAAGVRLVDTAEVYGSGRSERLIGRLIRILGIPSS
jgi:aryl-alcohol dehydrogenase-like predicted oxidoreductase